MIKKIMIMLLCVMSFVACNNEEEQNQGSHGQVLKASIESELIDTRAALEADGSFFWQEGDKIAVLMTNGKVRPMTLEEGDGGKSSGDFKINTSETFGNYAFYPYSKTSKVDAGGELTIDFSASYDYGNVIGEKENSFNFAMWGHIVNETVSFKHLGGVFKIYVHNLPVGEDMQFVFKATGKKITGQFSVDLTAEEPVIAASDDATNDEVIITFDNATDDATGVFYIPVPTGTYPEIDVVVKDKDGEEFAFGYWQNQTVVRRTQKKGTIGEKTITGGDGDAITVTSVNQITSDVLTTDKESLLVQVVGEVTGDNNVIEIPATLATETTTFSFASVADDAVITILNAELGAYSGQIIIEIPENETIPTVNANVPDGEVYIKQGTVTTLVVSSAQNTTIIGAKAKIVNLVVEKGNVRIEDGAIVSNITRSSSNQDELTYVIFEGTVPTEGNSDSRIVYVSSEMYEELTNLKKAIDSGSSYTLECDLTLSETLVVPNGKEFTLNLNGHTISQVKECTSSYSMIENKGTLTITGNGKLSFTDISAGDPKFGWGAYTLSNYGTLVVENGTIENLSAQNEQAVKHMYCAIQQGSGAVSTTINGGIISTPTYRSVRLNVGALVVIGGTFEGQVWLQPNQGNVTMNISGGEFSPRGVDGSSIFMTNVGEKYTVASVEITGGKFNTKIGASNSVLDGVKGCIKGGIFTETAKTNTNNALIAEGYVFDVNSDDTYTLNSAFVKTSDNTYEIHNLAGLKLFRDLVNNGTNYFNGCTIDLINDIDLCGEEWTPIGSATQDHGFMGNFDGNGKTIKNLKISNIALDSDGYAYAGLFGVTEGANANNQNYIKNLTIENVDIQTNGHIVAAAIAYPYYTTVENVTVKGNIKINGGDYTAGVLAYTRRCVNVSNISIEGNNGSTIEGKSTVGGVISDIQMNGGLIANYSNFAASGLTIKGTTCVGGISGIISKQELNGVTVKNVVIVCGDNRTGIVSGALGGQSSITNVSYENVTGATRVIGATYDSGNEVIAIGDVYVEGVAVSSAEELVSAVSAGLNVKLMMDIELSEIITINKPLIWDGNGKTLTSTAARAINVSGADGVTIKNLTINASGERAINIIQNSTNVTVDNVTATAANYTVNVASSAPNAKVVIKNSTLNGLCTVNVTAAGANVTVDNSTINCNDNNTTAGESYAALSLGKEAVGGKIIATNSTINVAEGSDSMKGRNGAENGTVTINGLTDDVVVMVACITYSESPYYHGFQTLAAAVEFAKEGDVITLLRDITLEDYIEIKKTVTINLNGKKIVHPATSSAKCKDVFEVFGDGKFTIEGDGQIIAEDGFCVYAAGNSTVNLNGGYYFSPVSTVDARKNAKVTINGGEYKVDGTNNPDGDFGQVYTLNLRDKTGNYVSDESAIVVKGGKFYKYNPAESYSENPVANFVAEGYVSTQNGDYYIVSKSSISAE